LIFEAGKILDWVSRSAFGLSGREVVQVAKHYVQRNAIEGQSEGIGQVIGQVDQNKLDDPDGPDWKPNAIGRPGPEIAPSEEPPDQVEVIFNAPVPLIEIDHHARWQNFRVEHRGEIGTPGAAPPALQSTAG